MSQSNARVGIVMGSRSDLGIMKKAAETLKSLEIPCEIRISSAHRTPDWCAEYAETAEERGLEVIIAGAGAAGSVRRPANDRAGTEWRQGADHTATGARARRRVPGRHPGDARCSSSSAGPAGRDAARAGSDHAVVLCPSGARGGQDAPPASPSLQLCWACGR